MTEYQQMHIWARTVNESIGKKLAYYDMFMQEHPEDSLDSLIPSLLNEFARDMKHDGIDLSAIQNYFDTEDALKKIKTKYNWDLIKSEVYASIITRMTALSDRAKGQSFNESYALDYDDVAHFVSTNVIDNCLDIVCHNTNVLEANNQIMIKPSMHSDAFKQIGVKAPVSRLDVITCLYEYWAAYHTQRTPLGVKAICDSDNGPAEVKKALNTCVYDADVVLKAVTLNRALDVIHFRSDLALAFVEGGARTLGMVSSLPPKFVV